jgi:hypothetical protein
MNACTHAPYHAEQLMQWARPLQALFAGMLAHAPQEQTSAHCWNVHWPTTPEDAQSVAAAA